MSPEEAWRQRLVDEAGAAGDFGGGFGETYDAAGTTADAEGWDAWAGEDWRTPRASTAQAQEHRESEDEFAHRIWREMEHRKARQQQSISRLAPCKSQYKHFGFLFAMLMHCFARLAAPLRRNASVLLSNGGLRRARRMSAPARHSRKRSARTAPGGVLSSRWAVNTIIMPLPQCLSNAELSISKPIMKSLNMVCD